MIQVKPIDSKELQATLSAQAGITYHADLLMYGAYVDGTLRGICQFGMPKGVGKISDLVPMEAMDAAAIEALFIMGRATLNFIDLCGVHEAYITTPSEAYEPLVRKIGFRPTEDGKWYMNLVGFFDAPCSHH